MQKRFDLADCVVGGFRWHKATPPRTDRSAGAPAAGQYPLELRYTNGGYRSPRHALTRHASRHCWGTAANIYRIGDTWLDNREEIEKYAAIALRVIPGVWVRPYGQEVGEADDHLHIDIGYTVFDPADEADGVAPAEAG